jgi:membrane dipeptidase
MYLFDLHCDTLYECYRGESSLNANPFHVDLTRGRRYAPWCQVFAVWIPDVLRGQAAFEQCCNTLRFAHSQAAQFSDRITVITDSRMLGETVADGRVGAILAVEGAAALAGRMENLSLLAELGVRVITLTWNGSNELGHGCGSHKSDGLTPFGKTAVREMQRLGIVADVSHLNERGFWDVAQTIDAPFIASHSVSRSVYDHPRNLSDEQFGEIQRRGGVVGVNFCGAQLGEATLDAVYSHLDRFLSLDGETAVSLGGDLDGTQLPEDWGGIAVYEKLADYLLQKGWTEGLLRRIFFENAFNFFSVTLQRE